MVKKSDIKYGTLGIDPTFEPDEIGCVENRYLRVDSVRSEGDKGLKFKGP